MSKLVKLILKMSEGNKTVFIRKNLEAQIRFKLEPSIPDGKDEIRRGIQNVGVTLSDNDIVNLDLVY